MSNKPLAYRLGFYISSAVLLVFIIFIVWILYFHVARTKQSVEASAIQLGTEIHRNIRDRVVLTQLIASNTARQVCFYHEYGEIETLLRGIMEEAGFLQSVEIKLNMVDGIPEDSVFIAARSGHSIVFGNDEKAADFCIDEDTLVRYFPDLTKTGWSEPFRCVKKNVNISVFNKYFEWKDSKDGAVTRGSVKCELSLDSLQELINKTRIYGKGYGFLISPEGTFMTYPLQEYALRRNISDAVAEKVFRDPIKIEKFLKGESGPIIVYPPALKKAKSWANPTQIREAGWTLVITIPFSELYEDLFTFLINMSLIMLVVVGAIFFSVITITNRILRPLSKISHELHKFSNEIPGLKIITDNETIALQQSLVHLQERYEKNRKREEETTIRGLKSLEDLALASEIQQSIIPPPGNYSFYEGRIQIHSVYKPAQFISGDLYEFFQIDQNRFLVTIGDVSGSGIPAALFMGIAHTYIRSNYSYKNVKDIVNEVNKQLCKNNFNRFFLTLFMGIIDIQKETLDYCNAGHTPTFLLSAGGNVKELTDQHGLPVGLYPDRSYTDSSVHIRTGDALILYTDGISEQVNSDGEFFGVDNFYKLFNQMKQMSPEESSGLIIRSVADFGGDNNLKDDLSLVVLKMG